MNKQQIPLKNSLFLLLAAIIWGIAFVAQSVGMKYVGGFTFSAVRSLIGAAVLLPLIFYPGRKEASADSSSSRPTSRKDLSSAESPAGSASVLQPIFSSSVSNIPL